MDLDVYGTGRDLKMGAELEAKGIHFINSHLGTNDFSKSFPKQIDWVVHSAALSSPWGRPKMFHQSNVLATAQLADYALETGCKRFVHISSPSIYVDKHDKLDVKEDDPLPKLELNDYVRTKRLAEKEIDQRAALGLPSICLRPQAIVGRGDRAIFPRILKTAKRGFVPRIGKGSTQTDLTHVENVIDAIVCALEAPQALNGRKYNITNGESVELYSVIETLLKQLEVKFRWRPLSFRKAYTLGSVLEWTSRNVLNYREPLLTRYTACVLGASRTLNIDRARQELGYRPKFSIEEAMREVAEDLRGGPKWT
jgi:nucleoside-diphosphate-sugar epimerase